MSDDTEQSAQANRESRSRREFLRIVGCGAAVVVIAVVSAVAAAKAIRPNRRRNETCVNRGICRPCRLFDDCHLPQALSTRMALAKR